MTSCNSLTDEKENAISLFKNKKEEFNALKKYLRSKYIIANSDNKPRLIFINCSDIKNRFIDQTCDDSVSIWMNSLNINQINLEHDFHCKSDFNLNEINLRYNKSDYSPVFYYRYNFCVDTLNYYGDSVESEYLGDGWSLYIEKK